MSMPRTCLSVLAALLLAGPLLADDLERFRAKDDLAAQKLAREVLADITHARELEKVNPQQAVAVLQAALNKINTATGLAEDQRRLLLSHVRTRLDGANQTLRRFELEQRLQNANTKPDPATTPIQTGTNPTPGKGQADAISRYVSAAKTQLDKSQQQSIERAARGNAVFNSINESAQPIAGIVEYPKYWGELLERRKEKMDPKEVAILKALNSVLSVDFDNARFRDVVDYLQEKTGLNIFIHEASRKEAMVEYDDRVTLKVNKATVRSILRKIFNDVGLTYVVEEGSLHVMTIAKAREKTVARVYNISDLTSLNLDPRLTQFNPLLAQQMKAANGIYIANMLMNVIDPAYWQPNGGPGVIVYDPITDALIVRASAEMHHMVGGSGLIRAR